jgi:ABC-type nickel/cobalt efflux system permease component RcnA
MSDAHETLETAEGTKEVAHEDRKIALVIAILALFLSFSETLGKSAQTEAMDTNVKSADTWGFYQAKDTRRVVITALADQTAVLAAGVTDPTAKAAIDARIDTWRKDAAHYDSDRKELNERATEQEKERDRSLEKYHHYEIASAAFQIGIVLCSAAVITGIFALVWFAGVLGAAGVAILALGIYAPHILPLP